MPSAPSGRNPSVARSTIPYVVTAHRPSGCTRGARRLDIRCDPQGDLNRTPLRVPASPHSGSTSCAPPRRSLPTWRVRVDAGRRIRARTCWLVLRRDYVVVRDDVRRSRSRRIRRHKSSRDAANSSVLLPPSGVLGGLGGFSSINVKGCCIGPIWVNPPNPPEPAQEEPAEHHRRGSPSRMPERTRIPPVNGSKPRSVNWRPNDVCVPVFSRLRSHHPQKALHRSPLRA